MLTFTQFVDGAGTTTGNIEYAGGYSFGNSPAAVPVDNVLLDPSNTLILDVGGSTPGSGYDRLDISGLATLDGTLDVDLMDGFTPSAGQSFNLFAGPTSGRFSQVNLPALANGLSWNTDNLYTTGAVTVVPEPSAFVLLVIGAVTLLGHGCRRKRPLATAHFKTREGMASVTKMLQVFLAAAVVASGASGQAATVLFQDTFQGTMSNLWTIVRPNTSYYTLQSNDLELRANSGDLWLSENDAQNVFLIPNPTSGNFVVTLGLSSFVPTSQTNAPQIALLAYDSGESYVRADYGSHVISTGQMLGLEFASQISDPLTYTGTYTPQNFGSSPFYLRMEKVGDVYTEYYSTDGINYVQCNGSITYGNGTPAELGFCAMSDPNQTSIAYINDFEVDSLSSTSTSASTLALSGSSVTLRAMRNSGTTTAATLNETSGLAAAGFSSGLGGAAVISPASGIVAAGARKP